MAWNLLVISLTACVLGTSGAFLRAYNFDCCRVRIAWDYDTPMKNQENKINTKRELDTTPRSVSRRAMLKGSATAMPAILTLHSGAALARSSNLIGAAPSTTRDRLGRALCLDTSSVTAASSSGEAFDLGQPPYARVTAINEQEHHIEANNGSAIIDESALCERGGTAYYRDSGWHEVNVRQGIIVSATALTSFASSIVITEV